MCRRIGVSIVAAMVCVGSVVAVVSLRGVARAQTPEEELGRQVDELKVALAEKNAQTQKLKRQVDELKVALAEKNAQTQKLKAEVKETKLRLALVKKQKALVQKRLGEKDAGIAPSAAKQDDWGKMLAQLEKLIKEERDLVRKLEAAPMDKEVRVMLLRQHDTLRRLFPELEAFRRANELLKADKEAMRVAKEAAEKKQRKAEDRLAVATDEIRRLRAHLKSRGE